MELIVTHKNTDFDGFSCLLAATLLYPEAFPVLPRTLNENVRSFYTLHKDIFNFLEPGEIDFNKIQRLIIVDSRSWLRLEIPEEMIAIAGLEIHLWDHHPQAPNPIPAIKSHIEPVGAAVSLLVHRIEQEGKIPSSILSTLFLAGIYEDTGNLTFPGTSPKDARAAAFLLEWGADLSVVQKFIRPVYGLKQKEILVEMINLEKRRKVNGFQVSFIHIDIEGHTPGLSPVVDRYQEFSDTDATFVFFKDVRKNQCMVIGRSNAATLNVGRLLKEFGGGGHPTAGSALVKNCECLGLEERLAELVEKKESASIQLGDLMSYPVLTVTPETTMKEAARLLRVRGCTAFPVWDGQAVVGIISRRDFKRAKKTRDIELPVKAFMSRDLFLINKDTSITEATRLMVDHNIGRLPVMDNEQLIGIITRSDIMRYYYDMLPEKNSSS
ncbi:MAG TPA: CBS domain-containing protein [Thermodesulfobacteriota bacterium]|nr:CBS domain-containing protein [Thermodesulfobacteriota bacterium]